MSQGREKRDSVHPDGIVDFLNQRWMDYTGLSLAQYVADPTGPIHPEDTPRVIERWQAQMARGEAYDEEMRLQGADGTYRQFLVRTAPLLDESGRVVKWYGVSTDIEDRRRAEAELEESVSRLRALTASLMRAQDDGRRRIAQMLHETTAQDLAAVKMLLERLVRTMAVSDAERTLLAEGTDLIDRSIADVRTLSYLLHPPFLHENGLLPAVRWYAKGFSDRSGIAVDLEVPTTFANGSSNWAARCRSNRTTAAPCCEPRFRSRIRSTHSMKYAASSSRPAREVSELETIIDASRDYGMSNAAV